MQPRAIIPVLPTILTLGNLMFGFLAVAKTVDALRASSGTGPMDPTFAFKIQHACYFILAAMILDALDGRIARITRSASSFGAQIDTLADMVTFGLAPALMAKVVYEHGMESLSLPFGPKFVTALCVLYVVGAALRLARFTVHADLEDSAHDTFQGLPSPAAAGLIVSACIFIFEGRHEIGLSEARGDAVAIAVMRILPLVACLLGLLMVSRVPYVHVMQRYVGHRTRVATFVNMVIVFWLAFFFHEWALFVAASGYVFGGLVLATRARITGRPVVEGLPEPWDSDDVDPREDTPTDDRGRKP